MKTVSISGFGGGYEATCQKMLRNGMRFLVDKPVFDWGAYQSFQNVTGLCIAEGDEAKALDKAVCAGLEPTSAMHHIVISHLAFIHQNSYDAWIAEGEKRGKVYEMSEDRIDKDILIAQVEWQLKLDGGYDPMAELFKTIPKENMIVVDPNDPVSLQTAIDKVVKIMRRM